MAICGSVMSWQVARGARGRPGGWRRRPGGPPGDPIALDDPWLQLAPVRRRAPRNPQGPWLMQEADAKRVEPNEGAAPPTTRPSDRSDSNDARETTRSLPSSIGDAATEVSGDKPEAARHAAKRETADRQRRKRTNGAGKSATAVSQHTEAGANAAAPSAAASTAASAAAALQEKRPWYGDHPELETQLPKLIGANSAREALALLESHCVAEAPITQFYMGLAVGQLEGASPCSAHLPAVCPATIPVPAACEAPARTRRRVRRMPRGRMARCALGRRSVAPAGEAASCVHYDRALKQLPLLHAARNNLIRGLLKRGSAQDKKQALEHAKLAAGLQPSVAEMQYQLGVVLMRQSTMDEAGAAFEATLRLDRAHAGALVNGIHCLQQLPPGDVPARRRLEKMAQMGVDAGLWLTPMQRPPHMVKRLRSQPWWDKSEFPWCAMLEHHFGAIRSEVLQLQQDRAQRETFTPVGGRAAHDSTLVAAGEWREFPLYGNGRKYEESCQRCPMTSKLMESVPAAMELAFAGGGETLFSVLKPGTHLRPHCGSTNTRLTCHLGVVVPPGCRIRAGDEWREWKEGECTVFDDSWEHEVTHKGKSDRVVLLINFWHPELAPHERRIELNTFGYEAI